MSYRIVRVDRVRPLPPVTRLFRQGREVAILDEYGRDGYRVNLDRCRTPADLLAWLLHLSEKNWITTRHLKELIEHVEFENGITVNRNA